MIGAIQNEIQKQCKYMLEMIDSYLFYFIINKEYKKKIKNTNLSIGK